MKRLQVLGPGCPKCEKLRARAETAVRELEIEASVEKISDISQIVALGIMMTPALVVDGEVKALGRVPSTEQIKQMLT